METFSISDGFGVFDVYGFLEIRVGNFGKFIIYYKLCAKEVSLVSFEVLH
jgi:hypothetical protein